MLYVKVVASRVLVLARVFANLGGGGDEWQAVT